MPRSRCLAHPTFICPLYCPRARPLRKVKGVRLRPVLFGAPPPPPHEGPACRTRQHPSHSTSTSTPPHSTHLPFTHGTLAPRFTTQPRWTSKPPPERCACLRFHAPSSVVDVRSPTPPRHVCFCFLSHPTTHHHSILFLSCWIFGRLGFCFCRKHAEGRGLALAGRVARDKTRPEKAPPNGSAFD